MRFAQMPAAYIVRLGLATVVAIALVTREVRSISRRSPAHLSCGLTPLPSQPRRHSSGVALLEAMVLEQLCFAARCSAATLGGGNGAAARGACWRHMYGGITVWLDLGGTDGPQKEAYEQAEIHLVRFSFIVRCCSCLAARCTRVSASSREKCATCPPAQAGAEASALTTDELAAETEKAIEKLIDADPKVVGKKSLYVRLGARGDWPNLAAPGDPPAAA